MHLFPSEIAEEIESSFDGLVCVEAWGEKSYFYNPGKELPRGVYFCTIKEKDGDNDKGSELHRDGVYRFNFGLPTTEFTEIFGAKPNRPTKGQIIEGPWDFTAIDQLTPHPVYGWMGWVAILNPSPISFEKFRTLLESSYGKVVASHKKRIDKLRATQMGRERE